MARFGFWKCWTLITFFCWRGDVGHPSALLFLYLSLNNFQSFCLVAFCIISNAGAERNDSSWSCHFNSSKISVHYLEFNIHQMDHNTFILEILHQNNDVYFRDSIMYMAYKFQHGERNTNSRLFFFLILTLMSITGQMDWWVEFCFSGCPHGITFWSSGNQEKAE